MLPCIGRYVHYEDLSQERHRRSPPRTNILVMDRNMLISIRILQHPRAVNRRLIVSLFATTQLVDRAAMHCRDVEQFQWQRNLFGHVFNMSRMRSDSSLVGSLDSKSALEIFSSWLRAHEDAQVMLASVLVVVGIWWFVRTVLSLLINLICPLLVVVMAVLCVPQLRRPLMGDNYPLLANVLRNILLKLAANIKD